MNLGKIYLQGKYLKKDLENSKQWFLKARKLGEKDSAKWLKKINMVSKSSTSGKSKKVIKKKKKQKDKKKSDGQAH